MAIYQKTEGISGAWSKGSDLMEKGVKRAKIVTETNPRPSQFQNKDGSVKMQDVCKVQFEGIQEPLNTNLNRATLNALVEAFGEDSKLWMNKVLSVETEKVKVAGKTQVALYLVPEGFEKTDDAEGYTIITKKTANQVNDEIPTINLDEEKPRLEDISF